MIRVKCKKCKKLVNLSFEEAMKMDDYCPSCEEEQEERKLECKQLREEFRKNSFENEE